MKNGKSPGTDGFTVDFFKFFWKQLGGLVVRSLNKGFENKQMSITQREGIIICIPKGDKPREYIKNWRPISLLNVTYKIGSTCIANRIKRVLLKLINLDQTGFVAGRYIGDNLRLIYDMLYYVKEENLPGLLVSLDFEKAFDSVNWKYMHRVLKAFGFGEDICQWISAFYSNLSSSVVVNGKSSARFHIKRGCRQGDPISPYLFILCAEVLACKIRENNNIKGIQVSNTEHKISQFADDTTAFLDGSNQSFVELFTTHDGFGDISGLKLNYDKTCNVWAGSERNSQTQYLPHRKMTWNPERFKILGLWFTNDLTKMAEMNMIDKFNEAKKLFSIWLKRSSTPLGRVAILKSLILSKLVYLWILLPNPPHSMIQQLQRMCFYFVWDKKRDKIKRTVAVHSVKEGGLSIPNIKTYITSLKLMWMRKIFQDPKWKEILLCNCPEVESVKNFGPKVLINAKVNSFWKDVFAAYLEYYGTLEVTTADEVLAEPLFFNNKFKIGNKSFHYKDWSDKGVFYVKDLLQENGMFLKVENFKAKYSLSVNFLDYYGCINCIKSYLYKHNIVIKNNVSIPGVKAINCITKDSKGSKMFYDVIIGKACISNACKNWEKILTLTPVEWPKIFNVTKKIQETKLKWFQIKINNRILVTNSVLREMKVVSSNLCNFCKAEKDSIYHYLCNCQHVRSFWAEFEQFLKSKCENCNRLKLTDKLILFGYDNNIKTDQGFDFILLHAKFFVYKCRINSVRPVLNTFLKELSYIYKIDQYAYSIQMKQYQFALKWASYNVLITAI